MVPLGHGAKGHNLVSRAGVSSARGHPAVPEQGRPRDNSQVQPRVEITRQVHGDEAGLRSSQEVSLQVRVRSSNCQVKLGSQSTGARVKWIHCQAGA